MLFKNVNYKYGFMGPAATFSQTGATSQKGAQWPQGLYEKFLVK